MNNGVIYNDGMRKWNKEGNRKEETRRGGKNVFDQQGDATYPSL